MRYIPHKLASLPEGVRICVQDEIVRRFKAERHRKGRAHFSWYLTALTTFQHPDAPVLVVKTLERAWRALAPPEGDRRRPSCCGCLHARALRALKVNPSLDAVPNLVKAITSRYQRHAPAVLQRLRELGGGACRRALERLKGRGAMIKEIDAAIRRINRRMLVEET